MVPNHAYLLSTLEPRFYHPAMIDAVHISIKLVIVIVIIIIITILLGSCWCYCCCRRRRKRAKKRTQSWFRSPPPKKERKFRLPGWMRRKGKSNAAATGKVEELELPRYSSSSLGKVSVEEVLVPKKSHEKSWKKWKNSDLY
jgi:hypothetical protein